MEKDSLFYEQLGFRAHQSLSEEVYDGWLLRFAEGYTKRANSVSVVGESILPVTDKIKYCEEKYREQGLPVVFKIAPPAAELDGLLEERGYSFVDKTNVMTVDLTKQNVVWRESFRDSEGAEVVVSLENKIVEAWQYYYFTFNHVSMSGISTAKKMQAKIENPLLCTIVYKNKKAVACGLGVMEQGYIGLWDIVVKEEYRGQGLGKVLCGALLGKAKELGITRGYLSVVDANVPAKRLYKSFGFEDMYSYWYRVK